MCQSVVADNVLLASYLECLGKLWYAQSLTVSSARKAFPQLLYSSHQRQDVRLPEGHRNVSRRLQLEPAVPVVCGAIENRQAEGRSHSADCVCLPTRHSSLVGRL